MLSLPTPSDAQARVAGLLYLAIIVLGVSSDVLIRSTLEVPGDVSATAANLLAHEGLFRLSVLMDAGMALADVGLGALLLVLLWRAGPVLALGAAVFRLAQASILGINLLQLLQALSLAGAPAGLDPAQAQGLAALALHAHGVGYDLGLLFFAVNSVLTGILLWRSQHFPRLIGAGLVAAGLVYGIGSTLVIVAPDLGQAFAIAYLVPLVTETALCGWLLLFGLGLRRAARHQGRLQVAAA